MLSQKVLILGRGGKLLGPENLHFANHRPKRGCNCLPTSQNAIPVAFPIFKVSPPPDFPNTF